MRATLEEGRAKMEREFNHALLQMELAQEEKVRRAAREAKSRDYRSECH
jgi:hypothetical protein